MQKMYTLRELCCYVATAAVLAACGGQDQDSHAQNPDTRLLATSGSATLTTADYTNVLQRIYVGYFGRPADPAGLAYFAQQYMAAAAPTTITGISQAYQNNLALKALIDSFGTSAESQALYPGDNATFINAIYKNLFNRNAEPAGVTYWAALLDSGAMTRASAAIQIMSGAMATDAVAVDKKTAAAVAYTNGLSTKQLADAYSGLNANSVVRAMLSGVSDSTDVATFQSTIDSTNQRLLGNLPTATKTYLGQVYPARNGLQVTINSVVTSVQGTLYKNYTVTYTQTNSTTIAIDEAALKLYFASDAAMPQYGFFNKVYPGSPVTRTYTFTVPASSAPAVLEYDTDNFFRSAPLADSLQWTFPISSVPATVGSLSLTENLLFGEQPDPLPYASTLTFNSMILGVSYTSVGDYKLTAQGSSFTIANLSALDSTGTVMPSFYGLANGQIISAGSAVSFSLRTPLTTGRTVSLTYSFTVKETGQTFLVKATGKTN